MRQAKTNVQLGEGFWQRYIAVCNNYCCVHGQNVSYSMSIHNYNYMCSCCPLGLLSSLSPTRKI